MHSDMYLQQQLGESQTRHCKKVRQTMQNVITGMGAASAFAAQIRHHLRQKFFRQGEKSSIHGKV